MKLINCIKFGDVETLCMLLHLVEKVWVREPLSKGACLNQPFVCYEGTYM